MIISAHKLLDMEIRSNLLNLTEILLRNGELGIAKETGKASAILKERILRHDYSRADAFDAKMIEVKRYLQEGGNEPTPWK